MSSESKLPEPAKDIDKQLPSPTTVEPRFDSTTSWLTAAGCSVLVCAASAGFRSSGLVLVAVKDSYGLSRGQASWPNSIMNLMTFFCGVVVGPIVQKYPLRPVMILGVFMNGLGFLLAYFIEDITALTFGYGAIHGFGCGTILVLTNILLSQYFDKYRGIAFGLVHASSPLASFIFPSLMSGLMSSLGFHKAMLIIGIILTCLVPIACCLHEAPWIVKHPPKDIGDLGPALSVLSIFKEPMFYAILFSNLVFQFTFDTFLATIVDYLMNSGFNMSNGVQLLACFSAADLSGRLLLPMLSDRGFLGRDTLHVLNYLLSGTFVLCLAFMTTMTNFIVLILTLGPFFGLSSAFCYSLVERYLGMQRLPFAFGMLGSIGGLIFLLMPSYIGYFRDTLGSYKGMYVCCAVMIYTTTLPWILVVLRRKIRKQETQSKL